MRSTTVGWLTSMLRVLPVTADHIWFNPARPELRESISHPTQPKNIIPRKSPRTSAKPTATREREVLGDGGTSEFTSGSGGIQQGYHSTSADRSDRAGEEG